MLEMTKEELQSLHDGLKAFRDQLDQESANLIEKANTDEFATKILDHQKECMASVDLVARMVKSKIKS